MEIFLQNKILRIVGALIYLVYSFFLKYDNGGTIWPWEKIGIIGGTTGLIRGTHFILHGKFLKGIAYNPLAPLAILAALILIIITIIEFISKKEILTKISLSKKTQNIIVFSLVAFFAIRIAYHLIFGYP
jgi:hypothetical protein